MLHGHLFKETRVSVTAIRSGQLLQTKSMKDSVLLTINLVFMEHKIKGGFGLTGNDGAVLIYVNFFCLHIHSM